MEQDHFDIIIIGAGSGGLNIAGFMNKAGFSVLLIDKSEWAIGGDCLNYGCIPSKALIHLSKLAYDAKEAEAIGLKVGGAVDIGKVTKYIKEKQGVIRQHENADYFRSLGMTVVLGEAKFSGPNSVVVDSKEYFGKKIVIATGSRPRSLEVPGVENVRCYNNETIFDIDFLPKKFLFVGGGPIGIELGQCFQRLGSDVTVIQHGPKFLPKESKEIACVLYDQLIQEGMTFHFNSVPKEFIGSDKVVIEDKGGLESTIDFDAVFVAIGRSLNIEGLGIENAGIALDEGGRKLKVDDYMRTTNKNVFACGDVAGGYIFTHAAELHASVIINNFFSPFKKKLSYDNISWVTYTYPEIATFGLSAEALESRGMKYETLSLDFEDDDRHIVDDFTAGKLVVYHRKGVILGGSMVSPAAGELFQELVLANTSGLKLKDLFGKIYPYPTASRVNKKLAGNYFSKKLTPLTKKILKVMYR
ncbi:MAG: NAD(P)/FAD-dependent oxidoreductase [Waddliaceae bacterium]|nr:NAD(P)/FAD-dependent oxidoreductase [Waddliaceae bacterium]MBT3578761.1 NAD(P)/FAD-dependent oxidoreductase [Waddliaceae bacterium]MBT4444409.1 NAD(P)/FAD-dependent oxidoreductase [Waddliaceae bacterium]MBT6927879.1 NAD(P)/FAD-dependent oxidoreductase [Waddliaceae bacterium]MBT7265219.1 NAD(P)/FAD-dependent oxidoreductase [Waddliaceae bacterium]